MSKTMYNKHIHPIMKHLFNSQWNSFFVKHLITGMIGSFLSTTVSFSIFLLSLGLVDVVGLVAIVSERLLVMTASPGIFKTRFLWLPWKHAAQIALQDRTSCKEYKDLKASTCYTMESTPSKWVRPFLPIMVSLRHFVLCLLVSLVKTVRETTQQDAVYPSPHFSLPLECQTCTVIRTFSLTIHITLSWMSLCSLSKIKEWN